MWVAILSGESILRPFRLLTQSQMTPRKLAEKLLERGFFPDHLTPSFNSERLSAAYDAIADYVTPLRPTNKRKLGSYPRAKIVRHSVPKRRLSRRFLATPIPYIISLSRKKSRSIGAISRNSAPNQE